MSAKSVLTMVEDQLMQNPFDKDVIITVGEGYLENKRYRDAARVFGNLYFVSPGDFLEALVKFQEEGNTREDKNLKLAIIDMHLQEKMYRDALFEIEALLEKRPEDLNLINLLIKISHKVENKKTLIPVLEKVILLNKRNIRLYELLAGSYVLTGNSRQAMNLYEKAIELDPDNHTILSSLGDLYYDGQDFENAIRIYTRFIETGHPFDNIITKIEQAVKQGVNIAGYYFLLAKCYSKSLRPDDAIGMYRKAAELFPQKAKEIPAQLKIFLETYPGFPEAKFLRADLLIDAKEYTGAIVELTRVLKSFPKYIDRVIDVLYKVISLCPEQVLAYQALADAFFIKGNYQKTLLFYQQLLDVSVEETDSILNRVRNVVREYPAAEGLAEEIIAKAYLSRKQFRKCVQTLIALQQKQVLTAEGLFTLGRAYINLNEIDSAIVLLKQAVLAAPYEKKYHQEYQKVVYSKLDRGIVELSRISQKTPHKYSLYYLLGRAYFQRNDIDSAINFLQISLKDSLKERDANKLLGFCFKERGRFDLAAEQFDRALELLPENNIDARKKLQLYVGLTYEAQGEKDKAVEVYEQIMVQDINYENIKIRIEKLKGLSWVDVAGKALLAINADPEDNRIVLTWAKNNEGEQKKELLNVNLPFALEHNNLGVSKALQGKNKDAIQELYVAQQFDEGFNITNNNLAAVFLQEKDLGIAQEYLEKGLSQNKDIAVVNANYATLLMLKGEHGQALEYYKKSIAIDDSLFLIHINMGDIYYLIGDVEKAIVSWQKALRFGVLPELASRRLKYCNLKR